MLLEWSLEYGRSGADRLHWLVEEPINILFGDQVFHNAFHGVLQQSGLILHTSATVGCGMGLNRGRVAVRKFLPSRLNEMMRILEAYANNGLIPAFSMEDIKGCRMSMREIKRIFSDLQPGEGDGDESDES